MSKRPTSPEDLRRLIDLIEQGLAGLPDPPGIDLPPARWHAARARHDAAVAALSVDLEQAGVRTSFGSGGVRVTARGISASCTAGTAGALWNWIAAARRRLATEGAE